MLFNSSDILSHQKLSISFLGRRLGCRFLLPHFEQNQEVCERLRPRMHPESPLSLWKQEASCGPAPIQATSPSFTYPAPSTCGSLFKAPHQGLAETTNRGRKHESLEKESTLLLSCRPIWFTPHRRERKVTDTLKRFSSVMWTVSVGIKSLFHVCRAPCYIVDTVSTQ